MSEHTGANRRRFLGGLSAAALGSLAGCIGQFFGSEPEETATTTEERTTTTTTTTATTTTETEETTESGETTETEETTATTTTPASPSFGYTIDEIVECGSTCREVTATLRNDGSGDAEDVTVTINIYADDDLLWEDTESIGTLEAGGSYTTTKTVDVGFSGGAAIRNNDGYVTIETIIDWDGGEETFENREKVA
jgi:hypothetical protein